MRRQYPYDGCAQQSKQEERERAKMKVSKKFARIGVLALSVLMVLALAACGGNQPSGGDQRQQDPVPDAVPAPEADMSLLTDGQSIGEAYYLNKIGEAEAIANALYAIGLNIGKSADGRWYRTDSDGIESPLIIYPGYDWANGKRYYIYAFSVWKEKSDYTFAIYLNANGTVNSINLLRNANSLVKLYDSGYEPFNYYEFLETPQYFIDLESSGNRKRTESEPSEPDNESSGSFRLVDGQLGAYGKQSPDYSDVIYYYVPAGTYRITNNGKNATVWLISDSAPKDDNVAGNTMFAQTGETGVMTIIEGQHIELTIYADISFEPADLAQ
jgi:hypothetical protein